MAKKYIIREGVLGRLKSLFFNLLQEPPAKRNAAVDKLRKTDAGIGKAWDEWQAAMEKSLLAQLKMYKKTKPPGWEKDVEILLRMLPRYKTGV